ncbi:MAG: hypothetical protein AAF696_07215, partial [Bacteroidota bacterium]
MKPENTNKNLWQSLLSRLKWPRWFQRLDAYFLENHPIFWRTKSHYILFQWLIPSMIVMAIIALIYPMKFNELPLRDSVFQILFTYLIISLIFTFIWGIQQSHIFLKAKSYWDYWRSILVYFLIFSFLVLNCVIFFKGLGQKMLFVQSKPFVDFKETTPILKKGGTSDFQPKKLIISSEEKQNIDQSFEKIFGDKYIWKWYTDNTKNLRSLQSIDSVYNDKLTLDAKEN